MADPNNSYCHYCLEPLDNFREPVALTCKHLVCRQCFNELSEKGKHCPFHQKNVELKEYQFEEDILCPLHKFPRNALNRKTNQLLCHQCESVREDCIKANIKTLKNRCEDNFKQLLEKSNKIMEVVGSDYFNNFFEGISWVKNYETDLLKVFKEFENSNDKSIEEKISILEKHYIFIQHPQFRKQKKDTDDSASGKNMQKVLGHFGIPEDLVKTLNQDSGDEAIQENEEKIMQNHQMIFENNEEKIILDHKRILEEIEVLKKKGLKPILFFSQFLINKDNQNFYFAKLKQGQRSHISIKGLGIGCPSVDDEILYIEKIYITVADARYQFSDIMIKSNPGQITSEYLFEGKIRVELPQEISIQITTQGSNNYLFRSTESSFFVVRDIDDHNYQELFPILYFLID